MAAAIPNAGDGVFLAGLAAATNIAFNDIHGNLGNGITVSGATNTSNPNNR